MSDFVVISWQHVGYAAGFLAVAVLISFFLKLGVEGRIIVGGIRTFAQLLILGYVLSYVFSQRSLGLTMLIFVLMVLVAAVNAYTMETRRHLSTIALFFFTLLFVLIIIIVPVGKLILSLKPWFLPQYIIPFGGMAIGNAMTAGMKTGLVPTINTMMVVGLVHIPGIFGGVVLAGVSPVEATKYQIVVMYMLAMGASLTTFIVSWATLNSLFTSRAQLRAEELG